LRIVYLGTSEFAAAVLRWLAGSSHSPVLVVTPPDRPRGRGRRVAPPPAADAARHFELDLLQTADVNGAEAVARVRSAKPELGVVCAFGQLIKDPLLSELEMLNVHPSLLPRWRGAAPIERAIMAGDAATGVTVLRVVAGLDCGPIALQTKTPIHLEEDYGSLARRLAERAGELVLKALDLRASGELEFAEQGDSLATYAHKIAPDERRLDPGLPAADLARRVRALNPHIGTFLELDGGERLGVSAASAEEGGELRPGGLVGNGALRLGCAEGVLRLDVVQPPGGRPMPAEAYLRGHSVPQLAV
jgi:methionyl-tRNA formyltransferase